MVKSMIIPIWIHGRNEFWDLEWVSLSPSLLYDCIYYAASKIACPPQLNDNDSHARSEPHQSQSSGEWNGAVMQWGGSLTRQTLSLSLLLSTYNNKISIWETTKFSTQWVCFVFFPPDETLQPAAVNNEFFCDGGKESSSPHCAPAL